MSEIYLFENNNVSETLLREIISIKSESWPYTYEQHLEWMQQNLGENDIHVLLESDGEFVAYLNLIDIKLNIDQKEYSGLGIGNVCSRIYGKGFGRKMMEEVNSYLLHKDKIGLLFCKDSLVPFYKKVSWNLIPKEKTKIHFKEDSVNIMIIGAEDKFRQVEYKGPSF